MMVAPEPSPLGRQGPSAGRKVCVTGAGGFVASWVVKYLLEKGYFVRGTVRDAGNAKKYAHLLDMVDAHSGRLELVALDLGGGVEEYRAALEGCEYVVHVAGPPPVKAAPGRQALQEVVRPAVQSMETLMSAVKEGGVVRRVVVTSSVGAIRGDTDPAGDHVFTEDDWNTTTTLETGPHQLAKTLAERAAWQAYGDQLARSGSRADDKLPPPAEAAAGSSQGSAPSRHVIRSLGLARWAKGATVSAEPSQGGGPAAPAAVPGGSRSQSAPPGGGSGSPTRAALLGRSLSRLPEHEPLGAEDLLARPPLASPALGRGRALQRCVSLKQAGALKRHKFELVAMNPGVILGPVMAREHLRSSPQLILDLLKGTSKSCPELHFPVVDVRDVAWAHVAALEDRAARGRFQLVAHDMWLKDVADILRQEDFPVPEAGKKARLPWQAVARSIFSKVRTTAVVANAGRERHHSSAKAERELKLSFFSREATILDTALSIMALPS